jgi:hypothetical protein
VLHLATKGRATLNHALRCAPAVSPFLWLLDSLLLLDSVLLNSLLHLLVLDSVLQICAAMAQGIHVPAHRLPRHRLP